MDTLLMVAVVVISVAVLAQAAVLLAMYLLSRRVAGKIEVLMDESHRLMEPLESITGNLKIVSEDLSHTGKIAREHVVDAVDEACETAMRPIRQYSALARAITEGVRVFFGGRRAEPEIHEQHPAA